MSDGERGGAVDKPSTIAGKYGIIIAASLHLSTRVKKHAKSKIIEFQKNQLLLKQMPFLATLLTKSCPQYDKTSEYIMSKPIGRLTVDGLLF